MSSVFGRATGGIGFALRNRSQGADAITELVRIEQSSQLVANDLVHGDLLATQFLRDDRERLTGVTDWDSAGRGDRSIDLALLFLNVHAQADRLVQPTPISVVKRLAGAVSDRMVPRMSAALGYHLLKMLHFVSEHNAKHIEWRTDLARRVLENYRTYRLFVQ